MERDTKVINSTPTPILEPQKEREESLLKHALKKEPFWSRTEVSKLSVKSQEVNISGFAIIQCCNGPALTWEQESSQDNV